MAPRKSSTTVAPSPAEETPETEKKVRQRHAPVNIQTDLLVVEDVTDDSAFSRIETVLELLTALNDSFQRGVTKSLPIVALSADYKTAERVVRHHAQVAGVGVSVRQQDDRVVFRARVRRQRKANNESAS